MYFLEFQVLSLVNKNLNEISRRKCKDVFFNKFFILLGLHNCQYHLTIESSISNIWYLKYYLNLLFKKSTFLLQSTYAFHFKNSSTKNVLKENEKNYWILVATPLGVFFILCVMIMLTIYYRKSKTMYCT